jgi:hypothetical protein
MGDDLDHAKAAIRWATDYLLKAVAHPGVLYVQVMLYHFTDISLTTKMTFSSTLYGVRPFIII